MTLSSVYIIEGLDCSGKKSIAEIVIKELDRQGIKCRKCIGPLYGGFLRGIDDYLVGLSYKKTSTFLRRLRKRVYIMEPVLDGLFYKEHDGFCPQIVLKISSHFRTWARAIVEQDKNMIRGFEKHRKYHLKFLGASLIVTNFNERIARHRIDVQTGKTDKIESIRFMSHNKEFFDSWNHSLMDLLTENIEQTQCVENNDDVNIAASKVISHIIKCLRDERICND